MSRVIEKTKKYLGLILIVAIALVAVTMSTSAVQNTIEIGDAQDLPAYIGGVTFATKTTTSGKYLYCLEMAKNTTMHTTATLTGERDAGIANIILNGFPNKSFTGDASKDYYITQTAIWWYLDETTGSTNLGEIFKETGADQYNLRGYVKSLVESGLKAKDTGYTSTKISLSTENNSLTLDGDYYTSDIINVDTNANTYIVSLEGAPENTQIVGATTGKVDTTFNNTEGIIIKVPSKNVNDTSLNIKVKATANGMIYKALEYTPSNENMQKVTPGDIEPTEDKVTTSIDLGLETTEVIVTKYDSITEEPLPGAKLVLKDSEGNVVTSWTSTSESHIIKNLAYGTYTVSEEEAPVGYQLSTDVVDFTISDTEKEIVVKFYNTPKEDTVVNITKIDSETGLPLAGAVMIIKDSEGNEVERFTTTEEAHVITGLAYGKYTLSEVSAPTGYKTSDEVMEFTLDDQHISYQIKFANYKEIYVPDTSTNSLLFTIIGIAIIGSGLGYVYKNGKKAK